MAKSHSRHPGECCIYCLADSSPSRAIAHVIPEAIAQNALTLPRGVVCDSCNQYLGHELDSTLVAHPAISLVVQFLGFPGKRGKTRDRIGSVQSDVHPDSITIPCEAPRKEVAADGSVRTIVSLLVSDSFDYSRFRRALHHIGLNALAYLDGAERALDPRYDRVRQYIRQPRKGERWPFLEWLRPEAPMSGDIEVVMLRSDLSEYPVLSLAGVALFGVDLTDSGSLQSLAQPKMPAGSVFVSSNDRTAKRKPHAKGERYRLTIFRENEDLPGPAT